MFSTFSTSFSCISTVIVPFDWYLICAARFLLFFDCDNTRRLLGAIWHIGFICMTTIRFFVVVQKMMNFRNVVKIEFTWIYHFYFHNSLRNRVVQAVLLDGDRKFGHPKMHAIQMSYFANVFTPQTKRLANVTKLQSFYQKH